METEVAEAMTFAGLSILAGSAASLLKFVIPSGAADDGICGEALRENAPVGKLVVSLIIAVLMNLLKRIPFPEQPKKKVLVTLTALFTSAQAVAQAKNNECYVYYIGDKTPDGADISELAAHITSAIGNLQGANSGLGVSTLNYEPGETKKAEFRRDWYNSPKIVPGCGPKDKRTFGTNCDEYPFFSTKQGGNPDNYPEHISLRLVGSAQNQKQGSTLGAFYRTCFGRAKYTTFTVMPAKDGITRGVNVYRDANGATVSEQCWPRTTEPMYLPIDDEDENVGAEQ